MSKAPVLGLWVQTEELREVAHRAPLEAVEDHAG